MKKLPCRNISWLVLTSDMCLEAVGLHQQPAPKQLWVIARKWQGPVMTLLRWSMQT